MKGTKSIRQLRLPMIDKWHAADDISDGTRQELLCFRKYMINYKNKYSDAQIMKMTVESLSLLRLLVSIPRMLPLVILMHPLF